MSTKRHGGRGPLRSRRWPTIVALLIAAVLLAVPGSALAQQTTGPTADQYDPAPERIERAVGEAEPAAAAAPAADVAPADRDRVVAALPFTGFDLALLAAAAVLLGLAGFALRRFTRTSEDRS